jgi:cyclopropane-fatty-acyl-phospholipid synthase
MWYRQLLEKGKVPDVLIRSGIRSLLRQRLREETSENQEKQQEKFNRLVQELRSSPIAVETEAANEQHYEVPALFFQMCLGKNLKYSSCYWDKNTSSLDDAEHNMLEKTCVRAELKNGQKILELGCGWGSLSLFMAEKYPASAITVVSNSHSQKTYIDEQARNRELRNLTVITCDVNSLHLDERFDRIVSVEMFEHMRNYEWLLQKIAGFLKTDGKLFVHIFTHKELAYKFEAKNESDWMSRYFFRGGIMPSDHLLFYFNNHLRVDKHWRVNGQHYSKTAEAWLNNMDRNRQEILEVFHSTYGKNESLKWWNYWRIFYMSCSELWSFNGGNEWFVSHYLFSPVLRS